MGRGWVTADRLWEGPPGSPRSPPARAAGGPTPPPHTPPRQPRYLPVHCRTGQRFAHRNRATQPARHTSGEKMAARARRKLPKVPERTGLRAAERAERAGARLRAARGGREDAGEWAPPPPRPLCWGRLGPCVSLVGPAPAGRRGPIPFGRSPEKAPAVLLGRSGRHTPRLGPRTSAGWAVDCRTAPAFLLKPQLGYP